MDHPIPTSAHPGIPPGPSLTVESLDSYGGFPDISEFNDPPYRSTPVDWDQLEASYRKGEILGVMIRVGFGTVRADNSFARNQSEGRKRGIPLIFYWFCYPGYNSAQSEANFFNSLVGTLGPYEGQMGDFENDPGAIGWPGGNSLAWAKEFLSACRAPQNATLWYCSTSFVGTYGIGTLDSSWGWIEAQYGVAAPDTLGLNPMGWQQTSSANVNGVNGPCDWSVLLRPPFDQWLTPGGFLMALTDAQQQRLIDLVERINTEVGYDDTGNITPNGVAGILLTRTASMDAKLDTLVTPSIDVNALATALATHPLTLSLTDAERDAIATHVLQHLSKDTSVG